MILGSRTPPGKIEFCTEYRRYDNHACFTSPNQEATESSIYLLTEQLIGCKGIEVYDFILFQPISC